MKSQRLSPFDEDPLARLRLERGALHLHRLGPRSMCEFLAELATDHERASAMLRQLEGYAALSRAMIVVAGADRFAPLPVHAVPPIRSTAR